MRELQFIIAIALCALAGLSTADARNRAEYVLPAIHVLSERAYLGIYWHLPVLHLWPVHGHSIWYRRLLSSQPSLRFRATPMATALMGQCR